VVTDGGGGGGWGVLLPSAVNAFETNRVRGFSIARTLRIGARLDTPFRRLVSIVDDFSLIPTAGVR